MPLGMTFGTCTFGQFGPLGSRVPYAVRTKPRRYRLEVLSRNGGVYAEIPRYLKADVTERVNDPSTIELTVDASEFCAQYLVRPNRIRVYDVADRPMETFIIWNENQQNDGGAAKVTVRGLSLVSMLAYERLDEDYHVEASEAKPCRDVVLELLALQENTPKISRGHIDSALGNAVATLSIDKGESLWAGGLQRLVEAYGGYMWVSWSGALQWSTRRGRYIGQEFRHGKNLRRVSASVDNTQVVTKLYAYGKAEGDTYLNLTDAGEDHEYLLASLALRSKYGTIKRFVHFPDIKEPERLLKRAQLYLADNQEPDYTYEADVIDLSHSAELGYDPLLGIALGNTVTVYDDILANGYVQREFTEVRRNLRNPEQTSAALGLLPKTLVDQVVVLDAFRKSKPDVPTILHRFDTQGDFANGYGIRHGDMAMIGGDWHGVRLNPTTGRLPGASYALMKFAVIHFLPSTGSLAGIDWRAGDLYYWVHPDTTEEYGGILADGTLYSFGDVGNISDLITAYFLSMDPANVPDFLRRVFTSAGTSAPTPPSDGWRNTDMWRDSNGYEYVRNAASDGWVLWNRLGSDPTIGDA